MVRVEDEETAVGYSVGEVAGFARVTVRALHHWEAIGLLVPGERTHAGHRRYGDEDLDRLQRILYYRELGFPLEEIAVLLDDPLADPLEHLKRRHQLLTDRIRVLREMAAAVQRAMEAHKLGINLTPEEKFEVFGAHDPDQYAEEAGQRWGDSDAYRESRRRTARYTKDDWLRIRAAAAGLTQRFVALMDAGTPPTAPAAMDLAEEHRQQITGHYYDCPLAMHAGLADMYVADERFTRNIDAARPGLAAYLRDAIHANVARRSR